MRLALLTLLALMAGAADAQSLSVYSEFARVNAFGDVTAPANPREILSPAIVRNGFTSFQVVVKVAPGTRYKLYVGENPEDALRVTLYREPSRAGAKMEQVSYPVEGSASQVFWMDVWADREAPVRRVKLEPQLNVGQDWVTYPMEVRVMEAAVPEGASRVALCGGDAGADARSRNLRQDAALASRLVKAEVERLRGMCGGEDAEGYLKIRDALFRMR